ncbi:MAG: chromosome segregation protein SMC [Actinomycetaceae bacterium]|nr:chromosome segregation protein SMC [Actinomycetaceae bacterium]MDY6082963.1 chromosome segregation protein SMC [Actinomycetaceae bacterium]
MYLKSLTLRGFKSFASPTRLDFEPGINGIVGPNGSGKSNIVDALTWVMGEQGAKNLRGTSMADVIFAGTAHRDALGRAQVSLTIDNSDHALPLDFSEVTISRTLFRSGSSEYAINGTPARLLDIQELLSDTGMGREMHVIIGQGRLDDVLRASEQERRIFVEEAAGVLKHRRRKEKTLRKLEGMQSSFDRIDDLGTELRRQLGPLARQAKAARRAQVVQATERDARARLLADDVFQADQRLSTAQGIADEAKKAVVSANRHVDEQRAAVADLEDAVARSTPEITHLNTRVEKLAALQERFRGLVSVADERLHSFSHEDAKLKPHEAEDLYARARAARDKEEQLGKDVDDAAGSLEKANNTQNARAAEEQSLARLLQDLTRRSADMREANATRKAQLDSARTAVEAASDAADRAVRHLVEAQEREDRARVAYDAADADLASLQPAESTRTDTGAESETDVLAAAEAALLDEEAHADRARTDLARARENLASAQARVEALSATLEPDDATSWAQKNKPEIGGLTRDVLVVEPGWERAIDAALKGLASGVWVESFPDGLSVLHDVVEHGVGRLSVLIAEPNDVAHDVGEGDVQSGSAESAPASSHGTDEQDESSGSAAREGARPALTAVHSAHQGIQRALVSLLDGVWIAPDAAAASRAVAAGARVVATKDGDILARASLTGGEAGSSILERKRYVREAQEQATQARDAVRDAERRDDDAQHSLVRARAEVTSLRTRASETAAELAHRQAAFAGAQAALEARRAETVRARRTRDEARQNLEQRQAAWRERQELRAVPEDDSLTAQIREVSEKHAAASRALHEAREQQTAARLAQRSAQERYRAAVGTADRIVKQAEAAQARFDRESRAQQRRQILTQRVQSIRRAAQAALDIVQKLARDAAAERREAQRTAESHAATLTNSRAALEEARSLLNRKQDEVHRAELQVSSASQSFDELARRVRQELATDPETLVAEYGPDQLVHTEAGDVPYRRDEQQERLEKARKSLARIGTVNPLALQEHKALEERQKYLADQLDDLKKTRKDLLDIVKRIDDHVNDVLRSALLDVQTAFAEVFAQLFPGGEGKLVLTEPDSPLTTGIEIYARPAGKRVRQLSLLSGGERSLTALAFLVAIFIARPSPFYVFDEVEAALDDVNLTRLLGIFSTLKTHSQLIVITHQQRTMEIADTLYGVAMHDDGVSGVISQRMADLMDDEGHVVRNASHGSSDTDGFRA